MKKRILLSLVSFFMMTAMWASLQDAYQIYVTGANGKTGQNSTLTLNMQAGDAGVWQWTCNVVLPAGIEFVGNEAIVENRYPEGFNPTLTATPVTDPETGVTTVTFTCYGADGFVMTGTDGAIATFDVKPTEVGEFNIQVKNAIMFMVDQNNSYGYDLREFAWTVEEGRIKGDADNNGQVDGADLQKILNIMSANGYDESCDIDSNGVVDGADYQIVLNIMASQA
ncbi:MAG: hypothetical protein J6W03_05925 [Bacteroidaceae bacterium]|nr:hypothetical protein [Bacteroidaceae bacterium]